MNAMFPLLLTLLGVSHGMINSCDARQDGAKCYGAQGGTVVLQLMDDASCILKWFWFKETEQILHGRRNIIWFNRIESRSSFNPKNGKLQMNQLSWKDSGEYTLEIYLNSSGANPVTRTLQLTVQAPVSSVVLVSQCLAERGMAVSCAAGEGDSPQYSWTLDGLTVKDSQLLSGSSESQIITLKDDVLGQLACTAKNHVSSASKEKRISSCATVSSVMLTFKCQSQGRMRAACFSEGGDSPQYSWTLDGETLTDSQIVSESSESQIITLKKGVSGQLVCSVRNHISQISACGFLFNNCISPNGMYVSQWTHESRNNSCLEPKTAPTMTPDISVDPSLLICSSQTAGAILIISGVFICFARKKNKSHKAGGSAGPEMANENTSVLMADMRSSESEL